MLSSSLTESFNPRRITTNIIYQQSGATARSITTIELHNGMQVSMSLTLNCDKFFCAKSSSALLCIREILTGAVCTPYYLTAHNFKDLLNDT
jgi:hypothetical protein